VNREQATRLIEGYIQSWREQDLDLCLGTLSPDVVVVECYGPEYHGIDEVRRWFTDWHAGTTQGRVTRWEIIGEIVFDEVHGAAAVAWEFECVTEGNVGEFPGASLFEFDDSKIVRIREYQMEADRYRPYG